MSKIDGITYSAIGWIKAGVSVTGDFDVAFSDSTDINFAGLNVTLEPRGFAVFTSGTVKVTSMSGKTDTFADGELVKGLMYPVAIKRVWATGTSATIIRIYY